MKKNLPFGNPFGTPFGSLVVAFCLMASFAFAQTTPAKVASNPKAPKATFEKTVHNFGKIPQGTPVTTTFTVKNTGKAPLLISGVQASCGCTTPSYTKEPIAPGKTGTITATYNAAAIGDFNKTITITHNAGEPIMLSLQGTVQQNNGGSEPIKNQ
jgi:archaellum component FlaG (FlaF/FlaG flagellin family)